MPLVLADISFGAGPTADPAPQPAAPLVVGADLAIDPKTGKPFVSSEAWKEIHALPTMKNLPMGVAS